VKIGAKAFYFCPGKDSKTGGKEILCLQRLAFSFGKLGGLTWKIPKKLYSVACRPQVI